MIFMGALTDKCNNPALPRKNKETFGLCGINILQHILHFVLFLDVFRVL